MQSTSHPTGAAGEPTFAYRPALDGVRALAVIAVLLFHGGVSQVAGGFLGVDAFFVLSGFLITSLLLAEHARHHRIRLTAFWARRARRLLPALLVVLVVVIVAAPRLISGEEVGLLRGDALATLLYVANWRMIYRGDDYFTQTATPSALQHAWSLGIEEQFYVLWPLIVVAILIIMRRKAFGDAARRLPPRLGRIRGRRGRALRPTGQQPGVLRHRHPRPGAAHRVRARGPPVPTGAGRCDHRGPAAPSAQGRHGGADARRDRSRRRQSVGCGSTPMGPPPGSIEAVSPAARSPSRSSWRTRSSTRMPRSAALLALPPLVWVGKISYGLYLWHWPLFQFLNADRTGLQGPRLLAVRLVATVAVSAVSFALIEQPIRMRRWPRGLPRLRPVYAGLGTFAVVGATGALIVVATMPPKALPAGRVIALPTAAVSPGAGEQPAPILRPIANRAWNLASGSRRLRRLEPRHLPAATARPGRHRTVAAGVWNRPTTRDAHPESDADRL